MLDKDKVAEFKKVLNHAQKIVVLQPDEKYLDFDSMRSALALSELLGDSGKEVTTFTRDEIPIPLQVTPDWEKISHQLPGDFDLAILVDTGGLQAQMPGTLKDYGQEFARKPFVVVDHHANRGPAPFPMLELVDREAIATGEVLYDLADYLNWKISRLAADHLIWSILADSDFLIWSNRPETLITLGNLAKISQTGINNFYTILAESWSLNREIFQLKIKLMNQVEFYANGKVNLLVIDQATVNKIKPSASPEEIALEEIRAIKGVELTIELIEYGGWIKGSMRSKTTPTAVQLAQAFGGGGHDRAAGFLVSGKSLGEIKSEVISLAEKLFTK